MLQLVSVQVLACNYAFAGLCLLFQDNFIFWAHLSCCEESLVKGKSAVREGIAVDCPFTIELSGSSAAEVNSIVATLRL